MTQLYPTQLFPRLLVCTYTYMHLVSFSHHFGLLHLINQSLSTGITAAGRVLLCGLNGAILGTYTHTLVTYTYTRYLPPYRYIYHNTGVIITLMPPSPSHPLMN